MRFVLMHKMNEELEKGLPPDQEMLAGLGAMMGEAGQKGIFQGGEGLKPSAQRVHLAYKNGKRTLTNFPFDKQTELVARYSILKVRSQQEALEACDQLAAAVGDVELFLGPLVENWDLGFEPKPAQAPLRFMITHKADARSESELSADPKALAKLRAVTDEMTKSGVLQAAGAFKSTSHGARVRFTSDKPTVIDGPFSESKEWVAGFAIFELPSKAEAIEWATRFGNLVKVDEVEIREMAD